MVSSEFFTFISKLFQKIHNNSLEFGDIPMLLIKDLAQLPLVKGDLVFNSPLWKSFFPLFLRLTFTICFKRSEQLYKKKLSNFCAIFV